MSAGRVAAEALLALAAAPALGASAYLALLSVAARRTPPPAAPASPARLDVIVPAHNEAAGITATVSSLLAVDYPRDHFRVVVVADNCTDETAERARAAGATVLERHEVERRGKGYALALAYAASAEHGFAEAVVVVDADTLVSRNLLTAIAARLAAGAECVQAHYGVRNAGASWRTRLMAVAFACHHGVRSLGRERLGLSCGLRGNGMAFTHRVLARVPHQAYSLVEDVEYGAALALAGVRVVYADEGAVLGEMPAGGEAARTQRERWERGRRLLVCRLAPTLLAAAARRRDRVALDLALDLLVPPLATVGAVVAAGLGLAVALWASGVTGLTPVWPWLLGAVGLAAHVARGCALSGAGARAALDLLAAPAYVAWKLALALRPTRRPADEWVRTARAAEQG